MSSRHLFTALCALVLVASVASIRQGSSSAHSGGTTEPGVNVPVPVTTPQTTASADGPVSVHVTADQHLRTDAHEDGVIAVELQADASSAVTRTPVAIALVIDTSGSMAGDKIEQARAAAEHLVRTLEEGDIVSVVSYGRTAQLVVERQELGSSRREIVRAINRLGTSGNTCMSCGMAMGYEQLSGVPAGYAQRVVLLSDGRANAGNSTAHGLSQIAANSTEMNIVTSTIGLGSDYDETIMSAVATSGSGAYYFLPRASEMASIFDRELASLATTVATQVELEITAPTGIRMDASHIAGADQSGNTVVISIRQLAAGQSRRFLIPVSYTDDGHGAVSAAVRYIDADDRHADATASLAIALTDDANAAKATSNPEVVAEWMRLNAMQDAEVAMRRMQEGDMDGASDDLDRVIAELEEQSVALGDTELAEEADNMRQLRSTISRPGFSGAGAEGRGLYLQNAARARESAGGVPAAEMYHDSTVY